MQQLHLRRMFKQERHMPNSRRRSTILSKRAAAYPLFESFDPMLDCTMPDFWKTGKRIVLLNPLVSESVLHQRLVGRFSAHLYERSSVYGQATFYVRNFGGGKARRYKMIDLWIEFDEDYVLLKLAGLPVDIP
jgi:hypothetical protein